MITIKKYLSLFGVILVFFSSFAQKNWHLKDIKDDGFAGISLDKAYKLLKDNKRQSTPVIVAILDSGVDTTHQDLKPFLWNNPDEIPNNGIDDDHNGYIDDIHGWNFLGNAKGENIDGETLELTREYVKFSKYFENKDTNNLSIEDKSNWEYLKKIRANYFSKIVEKKTELTILEIYLDVIRRAKYALKTYLKKDTITIEDVKKLKNFKNDTIKHHVFIYKKMLKDDLYEYELLNQIKNIKKKLEIELNPEFNARAIVGDNPLDINDSIYGNSDVTGPSASHGTFVTGIIGADRNNNNDAFGIADNVKFMILRIVPGGDERDKDVANAIKYATNKGARIINMSFGKNYSPEKYMVDEAVKQSAKKHVMIIHAAGNEGENNDVLPHYPTPYSNDGKLLTPYWLDVGASNIKFNKDLPASFSNYGSKSVDLFAPGVKIFSTSINNRFQTSSGTSAACPVVTGVAALIMSYFPELTTAEVKEILLKSVVEYKRKVNIPSKNEDKGKTSFKNLSVAGGIVNAEKAVKLALKMIEKKN